eukprot:115180-Chlamydomonas_euryale.AAC.1
MALQYAVSGAAPETQCCPRDGVKNTRPGARCTTPPPKNTRAKEHSAQDTMSHHSTQHSVSETTLLPSRPSKGCH